MHLDAILVDEDITGGLEPRLGIAHLRTLTIMGFPSQTWPGLLDELNRLAFPTAGPRGRSAWTRPMPPRRWAASPAVVRQAQVDHGDPQGGDDQRSIGIAGLRCRNKALDADLALQELAPMSWPRPMSPRQ